MKTTLLMIFIITFGFECIYGQNDTLNIDTTKYMKNYYPLGLDRLYRNKGKNHPIYVPKDSIGIQTKFLPSMIMPVALIGYGLTTLQNHGIYSSYRANLDFDKNLTGIRSHVDNYLIYLPYLEFGALLLLKVKNRNDFLNTAILILKAEIIMNAIVFPLKYIIHEERPYSYDLGQAGVPLDVRKKDKKAFLSMPSGHTAQAFCAATIVYREYRHKSIWYGVGAYAIATTVGLYRMINDQHWESDVFVGAGIGILSANLAYAFHEHRWGKHAIVLTPAYDGMYKGFSLTYNF